MFKTLTAAAAIIAASATIASADFNNLSSFAEEQVHDTRVELGNVRAESAGVVEIYSYHGGELGALLGSEAVAAGVNFDVEFGIDRAIQTDALAVLKVNGQIVDTQELEFE